MAGNAFESTEQLNIEVLVPYASDFSLEDLRTRTDGDQADEDTGADHSQQLFGLSSIPLRTSLHFDLEAQAFGSEYQNPESLSSQDTSLQPQRRDVIWSGSVDTTQGPVAIDNEDEGVLVWALGCFLGLSQRDCLRLEFPLQNCRPPKSPDATSHDLF
ncbi:MAG: hypothetical protein Q9201_002455 [Fulgogasparrea decipioides]